MRAVGHMKEQKNGKEGRGKTEPNFNYSASSQMCPTDSNYFTHLSPFIHSSNIYQTSNIKQIVSKYPFLPHPTQDYGEKIETAAEP